ncbi:MAG: thioesterase superfamily protein [Marmoricola sp.]|jgi:acyl-coenzyme A thioesterase PaaI-like protein|nr:thioesterase superfamily protein [Marmoricola sp.]
MDRRMDTESLPDGWVQDHATDEEIARDRSVWEPFTQSLRELVDLTIRSEADLETVRAAHAQLLAINERLGARVIPGTYGVRLGESSGRNWGNAIMGVRNAIAPPLDIATDGVGRAWVDFTLGAAYEGPPSLVHGGVTALVLDHVFGAAAGADRKPRLTGTLTMRYLRGTKLGVPLRAEAHVDRVEGWKSFVVGHLADDEGTTVEADGVFILPRWARPA